MTREATGFPFWTSIEPARGSSSARGLVERGCFPDLLPNAKVRPAGWWRQWQEARQKGQGPSHQRWMAKRHTLKFVELQVRTQNDVLGVFGGVRKKKGNKGAWNVAFRA